MRPASIVGFERFFLASLALGLINSVLSYRSSMALVQADPAMVEMGFGSGFIITTLAFGFGIPLLLWFLIARKASNVAKWIVVVLTAIGMLSIVMSFSTLAERGSVTVLISLVTLALQLFAIYLLFRPDAKAWLESKGKIGTTDPGIFS